MNGQSKLSGAALVFCAISLGDDGQLLQAIDADVWSDMDAAAGAGAAAAGL